MPNSPTIVAASLDSKQLEDSISKLVQTVNAKTDEMAKHFTDKVGQMEQVIKNFGNMKFEGSSGGGTNKLTEGQKSLETQTKKTTQAAKEQQMSFDQLVQGLKQAMGVVSNFNTLRQHIDPSKQDYAEYERALARIVEYHGRLRNSALTLAEANERAFAFDARRSVDGLFVKDERLKQLNRYYAEEEKSAQRRQEQINKEVELYNEAIRKKGDAAQKQIEKEQQARDKMAESARRAEEKYQDAVLNKAWRDARRMPVTNEDQAIAKIERIKSLVESLHPIGIISKADVDAANALVSKLEKQYNLQKNIGQQGSWTNIGKVNVNQTRESLNELNTAVERNRRITINAEEEKRYKIIQTGITASETARTIAESMSAQIDKGGQITQLKELEQAWRQMRQAISNMSQEQLKSPLGDMMVETLIKTELAIAAVKKYNEEVQKTTTQQQPKNIGSSYLELSETLKSLTATYHTYNSEQRNSAALGVATADRIHRVNQEIRDIQRQMNRPTSLAKAIGMDESTLDHIADKIQALRAYKSGIKLTDAKSLDEINQVDAHINRLTKDMDKYMSKARQVNDTNTALGRSWNYMKNRLAFYFTVGASTQFIKNLIEVRSQYEMNERALGILIDSAERGTQIFNELSQMALVSPYTLIELSTAAKQLTAYDVAARDVVDTTRRLADMAAAVGIPIERLTYALGQIKAYGYLNSRDARMFANAGIPLVKQLSEYYTEIEGKLVSTADVYDRIKKKAIDYSEVMEVINHMTDEGGKFFDFQAKMADTLKVRLANLTLAWNNMLNEMGKDTQGVLTWGIGALRDLFKHWKEIDKAVKSAAWVVGIKVAFDFLLLGLNRAGLALGMWTHKMALSEVVGKRLAATMISLGRTMASLAASRMTWITLAVMTTIELVSALNGANEAQKALNESIRKGAEDNYNNISKFLEQYKNLRESLYETRKVAIGNIYDPSSKKAAATAYSEESFAKDIDNNEAKKAWEAIREQIELTTASSDRYIQSLLSIKNMSERIRQGFVVLEDIQTVNAALKELGDETIKVEKDVSIFFGLLDIKDGLINNLKDYEEELDNVIEKYGSVAALKDDTFLGGKGSDDLNNYQTALERLRDDLQVTTDSIINFIELKGWSGDVGKINQVFEQITQKLTLDNQLDPQKAYLLQIEVEEARSKAAKAAQLARIKDLEAAWNAETDAQKKKEIAEEYTKQAEIYNAWGEYNGRKKVEWERFTKWLKEQHISETTAMFRNMDAEDIKSLNFQEGKHAEFVTRMVEKYAKENKMSYDEAFNYLKSWVTSANQWSVFIPLVISTEDKKTVYQQLGEYDKLVDEADAQIERLTKRIGELRAKKELDKKETEELTKAEQELADAEKSKRDAEAKGGHGKKEKKDERAASKAQKQAETELQKALKDEIQLIEQVRSQYKKLTDAGVKRGTALTMVTTQFGASIEHINKVLQKNGMPKFDVKAFAGTDDPHAILAMLKAQIDRAKTSSNIKPEEIKALEVEVGKVTVDAQVYDTTKITKGLNNELDKLKEEYELAVELDANPELGGMFAEMFDLDLETLPKNAQEYAEQYTKFLNKYLKEKGSELELPNLLNLTKWDMNAFKEQMEKGDMNKEWYDVILKGYLTTREARKKEAADTIRDYEKLLEKYAEYEYKVSQIQKEAERERATARKNGANKEILDAIDNRERQELAKVAFEEFQKSPEWVVATGDLAGMTDKAIGGLIRKIEDYKKKAKDLDPKQIKQINRALTSLYKQQRQGNPFKAISNAMLEAKNRAAEFNPAIKAAEKELNELENGKRDQDRLAETADKIGKLKARIKELKDEQKEAGKVSASTLVDGINSAIQAAQQATSVFTDMMSALGNKKAVEDIDRVFSVLDKAGQGALVGAQIGGGYGAAIGAVAGGLSGAISAWADVWSGNAVITESVKESERAVRSLQRAYKDLEDVIEHAAGTAVISMKKAAAANRELQLTELKRQLQLELSRKSKNQDDDRIAELRDEIKDLEIEIKNATEDIVNDLLGISSIGDAAESMMDAFVEALRNGEDAMAGFNESVDDMIANMLKKMLVSKILMPRIQAIFDDIQAKVDKRTQDEASEIANAQALISNIWSDGVSTIEDIQRGGWGALLHEFANDDPFGDADQFLKNIKGSDWAKRYKEETGMDATAWSSDGLSGEYKERVTEEFEKWFAQAYYDALNNQIRSLRNEIDSSWTVDDIKDASEELNQLKPLMQGSVDYVNTLIEELGLMKTSDKALSALQQGIQGITEDTAGALEAYMNSVSQQVYLHSTLLTQIRDAVIGLTTDAGLGVQAQMLFQLQQSYLVQQSIEGMMRNVLSPSERAFQVELIS